MIMKKINFGMLDTLFGNNMKGGKIIHSVLCVFNKLSLFISKRNNIG
jgi:hypothetical protein